MLAIINFPTESSKGLLEVFSSTQAEIQLSTVHLARSIEKHIKPKRRLEVINDLKKVFKAGDSRHTIELR